MPQELKRRWPDIRPEDKAAVLAVLDRGELTGINGVEATGLEREWASSGRIVYPTDPLGSRICLGAGRPFRKVGPLTDVGRPVPVTASRRPLTLCAPAPVPTGIRTHYAA